MNLLVWLLGSYSLLCGLLSTNALGYVGIKIKKGSGAPDCAGPTYVGCTGGWDCYGSEFQQQKMWNYKDVKARGTHSSVGTRLLMGQQVFRRRDTQTLHHQNKTKLLSGFCLSEPQVQTKWMRVSWEDSEDTPDRISELSSSPISGLLQSSTEGLSIVHSGPVPGHHKWPWGVWDT